MKCVGAIFDRSRTYRYVLWRAWKKNPKMLMFIGLNPSTANENKNDNTITKLVKITQNNGYDGFWMLNLFALISTDPNNLLNQCISTIGSKNDQFLRRYALRSEKVVFCWGSFSQAYEPLGDFLSDSRADQVAKMFPGERYCLQHNSTGRPKHPLYCLDIQKIIPW